MKREKTLAELQAQFKREVLQDQVIRPKMMSEKEQIWWYKALTNLGKILTTANKKRRKDQ